MRNRFEHNDAEPEITTEEMDRLGDKIHMILPALQEGYRYELTKLSDGSVVVTIEG